MKNISIFALIVVLMLSIISVLTSCGELSEEDIDNFAADVAVSCVKKATEKNSNFDKIDSIYISDRKKTTEYYGDIYTYTFSMKMISVDEIKRDSYFICSVVVKDGKMEVRGFTWAG